MNKKIVNNYKNIIKNTNLINTQNISVKLANKNIANKNYNKNLLKLSNKKQLSIYIKSLDIKTRQLKKIISNWPSNKNSIIGNLRKKNDLKFINVKLYFMTLVNSCFKQIKKLETKNLILKIWIQKWIESEKEIISLIVRDNLINKSKIILYFIK